MRPLLACALAGALLSGCDSAPDYDADLTSLWVLASGAEAERASVTFGSDGLLSVQPVCNTLGGRYSASYGNISIDVEGGSRIGCAGDGDAAEVAFIEALEAVDRFLIEGDRLTLWGPDVRLRFRLHPNIRGAG